MAASSVTGIGHGSAEGSNKGNEHVSLGVGHLIGPHVVAAGRVTLSSNVASIQFPVPTTTAGDYIVTVSAVNASTANACVVTGFSVDGNADATLGVKGAGASDVVNWAVIKTGIA